MSHSFEFARGHVKHRYQVQDSGLDYSCDATTVQVGWRDIVRLAPGSGSDLYLILRGRPKLAIWLDAKQMSSFLNEFFQAWARSEKGTARGTSLKAAFDYGTASKANAWLWIVGSLLFPGLLAVLLLLDGFQTLQCNPLLEQTGQLSPAKVIKVSKNRRGNTVWKLEFTNTAGEVISGKRTAFFYDPKGNPTGPVGVVYAPEQKSCWDLSLKPDQPVVNRNQRYFNLIMTLGFGIAFAIFTTLGLLIGFFKLRRQFPHQELVAAAAQKL